MLIFDRFPDRSTAELFAADISALHGLTASVHNSQADSNKVDPFPFTLIPPIVLVERAGVEIEKDVIKLAKLYLGEYAGT